MFLCAENSKLSCVIQDECASGIGSADVKAEEVFFRHDGPAVRES